MQEPRVALDPRAELAAKKAKEEAGKIGNSLGRFLIGVVVILPVRAILASYFWFWFVLPVFKGAPVLTFIQSYGLMLVVNAFTSNTRYNGPDTRSEEDKWARLLFTLVGHLSFLAIGWLFLKLVYL